MYSRRPARIRARLLTKMHSARSILKLVLPLMAEQFMLIAVGSVDTLMVSSIGESAVAAVSAMDSLNTLFINMFTAIGAGGAVVMAQYLGRNDETSAGSVARQLLVIVLALSGVLSALTVAFHKGLVNILDRSGDGETLLRSCAYLRVTALSFPFLGIYNGCVSVFRAQGDTKSSLKLSMAQNAVNIGGNALMIYVLRMDVTGAALATLFARAAVSLIALKSMFDTQRRVHLLRTGRDIFRLERKKVRDILRQGIPAGVENSLFQLGKILVIGIVTTLPTFQRAANGVCNVVVGLANAPGVALSFGCVALVAPEVGACRRKEAMRLGRKMVGMMYLAELPVNLAMALLAGPILSLYALSEAGRAAGAQVLLVYALVSVPLWTPALGLPFILRSAGDARFTMAVSVITMLLLRVGACWIYVNALRLGLMGVWLAMFTDWAARSVLFGHRFISGKWLNHSCITEE